MPLEAEIRARLSLVRARLERAATAARRDPATIRLIAVSKTFGIDHVKAAAAAGQVDFGENRVQEALEKIERARPLPLQWHLVGHLQANKARKAVGAFSCLHSIDSAELLGRADRAAVEAGSAPEALVQVDLAGEPTKHGARPEELDAVFAAARSCLAVRVVGLMLLPPLFADAEDTRPYFGRLRELRDALAARGIPAAMLGQLSMGMSHDFEVAIQEGATMVRVGTAIFGDRT